MTNTVPSGSGAAVPPKRSGGLSARFVLQAVRRRPLALCGVLALTGLVAAGIWFLLPLPKETAEVVFRVAAQQPAILSPTAEGRVDFGSYKQSQAAMVKRRLTLSNALKQPGVSGLDVVRKAEPDALTWLDQKLKVDASPGSELMRVTLEGDNGDELRTLLDAIAKAYLAGVDAQDNGARNERLKEMQKRYDERNKDLVGFREQVAKIAEVLGSKDGPTLAVMDTVLQDELRVASREYAAAQEQVQLAEREAGGDAPAIAPAVPQGAVDEALRNDSALQRLEAEVTQARQVVTDTEALFEPGKSAPQVTRVKEALKAAEAKRDKYRTDRRPQIEEAVREAVKKADQERRTEARRVVERTKFKADLAKAHLDDVEKKIADMSKYRIQLEDIRRNMEQTEKLNSRLADEIEQVKLELGAPLRVTLADGAYVVPGIEGNRRLKYTLIVAGVVIALGFAGVVGWEYRSRRVSHVAEVTTDIGVALLGTVPPSGGEGGSPALVEAIDTARTMLLHATAGGLRSVLVTSAVAGEGKTSVAGHLAISLARGGFRTLLIDGDFHSPSAHRLFALPASPGLSEVLRGELALEEAVSPSSLPGLSVLPAGRWDLATRQALVGDRWREAKAALESRFDYVVIDTAPLLLVSDTLLLARDADGVVLSVLHGVSQVAHVAETAGRLQAVGAKLKGTILNGVWDNARRTSYHYGSVANGRTADAQPAA